MDDFLRNKCGYPAVMQKKDVFKKLFKGLKKSEKAESESEKAPRSLTKCRKEFVENFLKELNFSHFGEPPFDGKKVDEIVDFAADVWGIMSSVVHNHQVQDEVKINSFVFAQNKDKVTSFVRAVCKTYPTNMPEIVPPED